MRNSKTTARRILASVVEHLELRQVLAAVEPTAYEVFMVELINRARANPGAEATRFNIDLNEGLSAGTITDTARQPLAVNQYLTDAARGHAIWSQQNSTFSHTGNAGSSPTQRIIAAGYVAGNSWGSGENMGLTVSSTLGDLTTRVENHHRSLFIDEGIVGRGHRTNLLASQMKEVGSGVATGPYTYNNTSYSGFVSVQDFAWRTGNPYLVGVVYNESVRVDNFYTPGEGLGGVTVTATDTTTNATFTTTSSTAGDYRLQLPAGTYKVEASGGTLGGIVRYNNVTIAGENVKRDFTALQATPAPNFSVVIDGVLNVNGTTSPDNISITINGNSVIAQLNDDTQTFALSSVRAYVVYGDAGNDTITAGPDLLSVSLQGEAGNDVLTGSDNGDVITGGDGNDYIDARGGDDNVRGNLGADTITGGAGKNALYGDEDNDRINGSGGRDYISGGSGEDRLYGRAGNDTLEGGANVDRLWGDDGDDMLTGGTSADKLFGGNGNDSLIGQAGADLADGGIGTDEATVDSSDYQSISIEVLK